MIQQNRKSYTYISPRLQRVLQQLVDDIVEKLGCLGALATTLENDKGLYVRASAFKIPHRELDELLARGGLAINSPEAVMFLDNVNHQYNLSVSAVNGVNGRARQVSQPYLISDRLYDVLRPLTDRTFAESIQAELGIRQVVALPLVVQNEVVGNLLALSQTDFAERDIDLLVAFGRLAAESVQNDYRLTAMEALERVILVLQAKMTSETKVLQTVVDAVVQELGYEGAMVATLEEGNALPVRAYALDDTPNVLTQLEKKAGMRLLSPRSVVYLDDERYRDNLSVRAVKGINGRPQRFLTSDHLYDLLRPFVDKTLAGFAQRMLGIRQVIAVPFFLEDEIVGNLFVASRRAHFTAWEISLLTTFGQQAAAGIRNARLYAEMEDQREMAAMFGRMAFSATASVHALGNHLSIINTFVHMLNNLSDFSAEQRREIETSTPLIQERLYQAMTLLDNLHEPWRQLDNEPANVNACLQQALQDIFPALLHGLEQDEPHVEVKKDLAAKMPLVQTAVDMLTEAFRVIIKNGREAIVAAGQEQGEIAVTTRLTDDNRIRISIQDNGPGIPPEALPHIFDIGWSTKEGEGMGFGLFWTRDYVQGLGGCIEVETAVQKGTTFHITLPV